MNLGTLLINFEANTSAAETNLSKISSQLSSFPSLVGSAGNSFSGFFDNTAKGFQGISMTVNGFISGLHRIDSVLAGIGIYKLSKDLVNFSSEAERAITSLNVLTKGAGEETYTALRRWAMQMPINTEQAISLFIKLKARGINPTLERMTLLSDAMSALNLRQDDLHRLAKALGDISAKGKLAGQEIIQLANAGINIREVFKSWFNNGGAIPPGFTEDIKKGGAALNEFIEKGANAQITLDAIFAYIKREWGGLSTDMMKTWSGLRAQMTDFYQAFSLQVANGGPFQAAKLAMKSFLDYVNSPEGLESVRELSLKVSNSILNMADSILTASQLSVIAFNGMKVPLEALKAMVDGVVEAIDKMGKASGAIGASVAWVVDKLTPTDSRPFSLDLEEELAHLEATQEAYAKRSQANAENYVKTLKEIYSPDFMTKGVVSTQSDDPWIKKLEKMKEGIVEVRKELEKSGIKDFLSKTPTSLPISNVEEEGMGAVIEDMSKGRSKSRTKVIGGVPIPSRSPVQPYAERQKTVWDDYVKTLKDANLQIEQSTVKMFQNMEDALVKFVMTGKFEIGNFVNSIISELARIVIQKTITAPLADAFGSAIMGGLGSISSMFSMGGGGSVKSFATGGNIYEPVIGTGTRTGATYTFAERGIEHFGPGEKREGGNSTNIQLINNTGTPATAKVDNRKGPSGERQLIIELSRAIVKHDVANRGPLSQAMESRYGLSPAGAR